MNTDEREIRRALLFQRNKRSLALKELGQFISDLTIEDFLDVSVTRQLLAEVFKKTDNLGDHDDFELRKEVAGFERRNQAN